MKGIPPKILRYCKYQPRTEAEVRKKLMALQYEPTAIPTLISLLKEKNLLDDRKYAEAYIHIHLNKGWGRKKILQALYHKGIILQAADWDQWITPEVYAHALQKAMAQCPHSSHEKKVRFLLGRGFMPDEIRAFLARQAGDP
ncbi:MAG: regulatory protein RecX [Bacteroidia bacterium]